MDFRGKQQKNMSRNGISELHVANISNRNIAMLAAMSTNK